MAIMRVLDGEKLLVIFEAETVPAVGDVFWWQTNGPYVVQEREWHLPPGYIEEHPHTVTLRVKEMSKTSTYDIRGAL